MTIHPGEEDRSNIIRMSQYLFSPKSEEIRLEFQEKLLELILYLEHPEKITFKQINKFLENNFGIIKYPRGPLLISLKNLRENEKIIYENGRYYLSEDEYENIKIKVQESKTIIDIVNNKIKSIINNYDVLSDYKEIIPGIFYSFLVSLFKKDAKAIANNILKKPIEIFEYPSSLQVFDDILNYYGIIDKDIKNKILECFKSMLLINDEIINFLAITSTNFLKIEILNIDPDFVKLEKKYLSSKNLLLDTNVIMPLLLSGDKKHKNVNKIINIMQDSKIKLYYTERTKTEFLNTLDNSNVYYKKFSNLRPQLIQKINNIFIKTYLVEKIETPSLDWHGFYLYYRQIDDLLYKMGVEKFDDSNFKDEIKDDDFYENIIRVVINASTKRWLHEKSKGVAEHDAYHLLLTRRIRKNFPPDTLGPQFWFLTFDATLGYVDEIINLERDIIAYPSSMLVKIFMEFIMTLIGPDLLKNNLQMTFSELLQTEISLIPTEIDPELLVEVLGPWLNYKSLSTEEILKILSDDIILEYWVKLRKALGTQEKESYKIELTDRIEEKVSEELDRKVIQLDSKLKRIDKIFDKVSKILIFIFGVGLMVIGLYTYGQYNDIFACGLLSILGITLIVISANWKKVKFSLFKGELEIEK